MHDSERGLFDLRQGRPVYVNRPGEPGVLVATVDGLATEALAELRHYGPARLAVTHHRAASMGLADQSDFSTQQHPLSLSLNGEGPEQIFQMASARGDFGVDQRDVRPATVVEVGGLTLARLGRLLPAVVTVHAEPDTSTTLRTNLETGAVLAVTVDQINSMAGNRGVRVVRVTDGPVPLPEAEDARFVFFRESNGLLEHVAVLIGERDGMPDPVPVRIHSACLTGDLFGSLRCDCGEQLHGSLETFAALGGGVLLYMSQEGRDIGLVNKLRAYRLQEGGLDTIEADETLGFGADERDYGAAIEILKALDVTRVQLLTNNPEKVRALSDAGIEIARRVPLFGTLNRHNLPYVRTKVKKAGHWLDDMFDAAGKSEVLDE